MRSASPRHHITGSCGCCQSHPGGQLDTPQRPDRRQPRTTAASRAAASQEGRHGRGWPPPASPSPLARKQPLDRPQALKCLLQNVRKPPVDAEVAFASARPDCAREPPASQARGRVPRSAVRSCPPAAARRLAADFRPVGSAYVEAAMAELARFLDPRRGVDAPPLAPNAVAPRSARRRGLQPVMASLRSTAYACLRPWLGSRPPPRLLLVDSRLLDVVAVA